MLVSLVRENLRELRENLKHKIRTLETWAEWLQSVVNIALASVSGTTTFTKAARQFLLKWSFYRLVPL